MRQFGHLISFRAMRPVAIRGDAARFGTPVVLVACSLFLHSASWGAQWSPLVNLETDSADVTVLGAAGLDQLGGSIGSGDIDGDGEIDLLVLAAGASPMGRAGAGLLYVIWGPVPAGVIACDQAPPTSQAMIVPPVGSFGLYATVECGDYNGDGFDDIALGFPCNSTFNCRGKVIVIFGQSNFPALVDLQSPNVATTTLLGSTGDQGWFGYAVSAGNLNGDEYDDIVVSAPSYDPGGHVYIIHGRLTFPSTIDLSIMPAATTRLVESAPGWGIGQALDCVDLNGDGAEDLLIGAPGNSGATAHGKAILFYGSTALPLEISLSILTPGTKHIFSNAAQPGGLGTGVALMDFDGDGTSDIVLSASGVSLPACAECGMAYVFYDANGLPSSVSATTFPGTRIVGNVNWRIGLVMTSGDVNNDGRGDVALSAYQAGLGEDLKVALVYGSPSQPDTIHVVAGTQATIIDGESDDDSFGLAMHIGDTSGDGIEDLSIGAEYAFVGALYGAGKVYGLHGVDSATGINVPAKPEFMFHLFPNPSQGDIAIGYSLATSSDVKMWIYDVRGRFVSSQTLRGVPPGDHVSAWSPKSGEHRIGSGVYFVRVNAAGRSGTRKIIVLR